MSKRRNNSSRGSGETSQPQKESQSVSNEPVVCSKCYQVFESQRALNTHNNARVACSDKKCSCRFQSEEAMLLHVLCVHQSQNGGGDNKQESKEDTSIQIDSITNAIPTIIKIKEVDEVIEVDDPKPPKAEPKHRICNYCKQRFDSEDIYSNHLRAPFKCLCEKCPCGFYSEQERKIHIRENHGVCVVCERVFISESACNQHREAAHFTRNNNGHHSSHQNRRAIESDSDSDDGSVVCPHCCQSFDSIPNLVRHFISAPFPCPVLKCDCGFYSKASLQKHINSHHVKCSVCDQVFFSESERDQHSKEAHQVLCEWCDRIFDSPQSYNAHFDAPFPCLCAQCPCGFDSSEERYEHAYDNHFICSECGRVFHSHQARSQHQTAVHPRIECCGREFKSEHAYNQHKRDVHYRDYRDSSSEESEDPEYNNYYQSDDDYPEPFSDYGQWILRQDCYDDDQHLGVFVCTHCGNRWYSGRAYADKTQKCMCCRELNYPKFLWD